MKSTTPNMAELVSEPYLSAVFEKLFESLSSGELVNFFRGKKSLHEQLRKLNEKLSIARSMLYDAEERQISQPDVKEWLDELKHVVLKADDLVEDINDEARSKRERESGSRISMLLKSFFSSFTEFDRTVQGETTQILNDLDDLLDKTVDLGLKYGSVARKTGSLTRLPSPLQGEESHVYGRSVEIEEILRLLLADEVWGNGIGVLPIVGVGGLGKTTIAQAVFDDDRVKKHAFQLKAWVTVSTDFDISMTAKAILQQVNSKNTRDTEEPAKLQLQLKEAMRGKKILCVLDDIWEANYQHWDFLLSAFTCADRRSRIIVTTRSENVASIVKTGEVTYELRQVSEPDCWKIFAEQAFNGKLDADPSLLRIGMQIVEKCGGLPLALKSMGALLRAEKNPSKWDSILRSDVWELGISHSNNILPSLWLSYHHLPSRLKQCFAYCSIFPKDYEIQKEQIIHLWMAEGFLQSDKKEMRMEDVGLEYVEDLISRSLFQRSSHSELTVRMHHLVHDLALFVSGEFCWRYDDGKTIEHVTSRTRHLSHNISVDYNSWTSLSKAKYLRTFIGSHAHSSDQLVEKLIENGKCLRVLSPVTRIWVWPKPDSFSKLKHLRYLNLSGNKFEEIPSSICFLYNLQTLLLSNCIRLTRLPTNMGRLINLRHLDTTSSPLEEMPPQMCNLEQLQKLSDFVLSEFSGPSIKELGYLQYLGGKLRISGLQNVDNVDDVLKANLREKANLYELSLQWRGDPDDTRRGREVLDALQPHPNLKKLTIYKFAGSSFPEWVGDSLFSNLVSLHLNGSEYCFLLPPVGQLPSLQELSVKSFNGVETIGDEFYGSNSSITPFQSLESLSFDGMPKWHEWLFTGDDKEVGCFPRLKKLQLYGCPNLTGSLPDCDSTETLEIGWCNKLDFPGSYHYASLKKLRIEGLDSLKSLPLDYFPKLEKLVLEECQNLESLTFSEETGTALESLSFLRLVVCKNFRSLPKNMHRHLPSLAYMEMSICPKISSFPKGGLPSKLNELVLFNCRKLVAQHKHWDLQGVTSLRSLYVSDCNVVLDSFPEGLLPSSLTSLELCSLPHLKNLNGSAFRHVASLHKLSLVRCGELQFLPEEVLPISLRWLRIHKCPFLEQYWRGKGISHIPNIKVHGEPIQNKNDEPEDFESTNG